MRISNARTAPESFRFGFLAGMVVFALQLAWFWNIFGPVAICLWAVLSFFTGAFVLLLHFWRECFQGRFVWLAAPALWTGIEFFRSELYPLKFSWLSVGYLFSERSGLFPVGPLGVYGTGFILFLVAALLEPSANGVKLAALCFLGLLIHATNPAPLAAAGTSVKVAGIQLEFPPDLTVPGHLDRVLTSHPDAQILVLSEYAFDGPVPPRVRDWCRRNNRYLVAGGKEEVFAGGQQTFRNTAFVIGPNGETAFQQGKSVPIQFFNDGLPARDQQAWSSPWGRIAIPTCYDLSYRRVTDRFVAAGAQAFIVPFMDVTDWGERQHRLHTRIAPIRAREYNVPIFRLGSSGISQHVDARGTLLAEASFPGQEEIIAGHLQLASLARLPLDHWLAPATSIATAVFLICLLYSSIRTHINTRALDLAFTK